MAIQRYAVDGINGSASNSGVAAFEGDFSNAVVDIYDAIDKANTIHQADSTHTVLIEVSGGVSGITYYPTHNLVFTSSGTGYTASAGFSPNGVNTGDYGIVGSKVAGHDGQVTIDASTITTYSPYSSVLASNRRGTLFERLKVINTPVSGTSRDAVHLSTANFSAVRDCILEQGSHAVWAKRAEDIEISGNLVTGGTGANASAIKIEQDQEPQATRAIVANNLLLNAGSSSGSAGHFGIQLKGAWNCEVYNNTLVNTVTDGIGLIDTAKFNTIYNNIVVNSIDNGNSGAVGHDIGIDSTSTDNLVDYNTYATNKYYLGGSFSAAGGWTGGQVYSSISTWRAATGLDANSITTAPTFDEGATPSSFRGARLTEDSPQVGAGTPVSWSESWSPFTMAKDALGTTYASPPNMGALALFAGGSNLTDEEQAYLDAWLAGTKLSGRDFGTLRLTAEGILIGNYINWDHEIDNSEYIEVWDDYTKPAGRDFGTQRIDGNGLIRGNYIHTDYPEND